MSTKGCMDPSQEGASPTFLLPHSRSNLVATGVHDKAYEVAAVGVEPTTRGL